MKTPLPYHTLADAYRPTAISTLLVGEAPPPNGSAYFYHPAPLRILPDIRKNSSLPATIFHHYFGKLPADVPEYEALLVALKEQGVFLVDICDEPVRVRGDADGVARIKAEIPGLRARLRTRGINVDESTITFLLARGSYRAVIRQHFPRARQISWVDFRMAYPGAQ